MKCADFIHLLDCFWRPLCEPGSPFWRQWAASIMYAVRVAWYRGDTAVCLCEPCGNQVPLAWASGMCVECATENCEHEFELGGQ